MITITIDYGRHRQKEEYKVGFTVARSISKILFALTNKKPEKTFNEYMEEAAEKRDL